MRAKNRSLRSSALTSRKKSGYNAMSSGRTRRISTRSPPRIVSCNSLKPKSPCPASARPVPLSGGVIVADDYERLADRAQRSKAALGPLPLNNGGEHHTLSFAECRRLFLECRLDRAAPGAVIFLEQLLGRGEAALGESFDRLEIAGLVASAGIAPVAALEPGARNPEAFAREIERGSAGDRCLEAEPRHLLAPLLALRRRPGFGQVPGGVERLLVVQQSDPERRQRRQAAPRSAVGAAHLQIALEAHFRKNRAQVVRPVGERGALARQRRQLGGE